MYERLSFTAPGLKPICLNGFRLEKLSGFRKEKLTAFFFFFWPGFPAFSLSLVAKNGPKWQKEAAAGRQRPVMSELGKFFGLLLPRKDLP